MLSIVTLAIGNAVGCWIGVAAFYKVSEIRDRKARQRKYLLNRQNGLETCGHCLTGLSSEQLKYLKDEFNTDDNKSVSKCWCCGCHNVVKLENEKWVIIS